MSDRPSHPRSELPTATGATRTGAGPPRRAETSLPSHVGPYAVGEVLGRGAMGVVARATDDRSGREVALKFLDARAATDDAELLRVEREGRLLAAIRHPHVALLLGIEESASAPVLVLELVGGETLAARLSRGPLPLADALVAGAQVASALAAAHERGIVHRDLKPANIKLAPGGAKVLDFGLASREAADVPRSLQSETRDLGDAGEISGTPGYMSPEQVAGAPATPSADAWAFGCVLFEMLSGRRAFDGPTPAARMQAALLASPDLASLPQGLPPAVRELIAACLAPAPAARPSAHAVAALLATEAGLGDALTPSAPPPAGRRRLPRALSRFVGRRSELADLRKLVLSQRLTTLTGTGGSGKTRIALELGLRLEEHPEEGRLADGIAFVELATLSDGALLAAHVAAALGIADRKGSTAEQALLESLAPQELLLILDNCEHLPEAAADLVIALLAGCPRLAMLATSREPLRIPEERVHPLPTLRVPLEQAQPDPAQLMQNESVALFADRARSARRGFVVDAANAAAVARCCRRLDGIPLALELAAARMRHVDAERLASELDDCFAVLTGGSPAALPRHQALRATIDWSVDQLAPRERALLRRLSAFAAPFTLAMAEEVGEGADVPRGELLAALALLEEKSLVQAHEGARVPRFRLLEPIRQHEHDALIAAGEGDAVRRRLVLALAGRLHAARPLLEGPELPAAVADLAEEQANITEAVRLAPGAGCSSPMLEALGAAGSYFVARNAWREGLALMNALLPGVPATEAAARAPALLASAQMANALGDTAEAGARAEEARGLFDRLGNEEMLAEALNTLSQVAWERVELEEALRFGEASLALRRRLGLTSLVTNSLNQLGIIARSARNLPVARGHLEEALSIQRRVGNDFATTVVLCNLAVVTIDMRDFEGARPILSEALALAAKSGSRRGELFALINLAQVELESGRPGEALAHQQRAAPIAREAGDRSGAMSLVLGCARAALGGGDVAAGARFMGAALSLREGIGAQRFHDQASFDAMEERARGALGDECFEAELAAGRALSFDEALAAVQALRL